MPRGSTCKAKGCTANKNDNPELSFHSFPKNKERFKLWCDLIKRPDLNHGKAISSRMSMRVCSLHFEDHMYMSPINKSRLIWCAVPKPWEVKVSAETYPVAHFQSETDASEETDVYSSNAEDIIIKEEYDMDQDTSNDVSVPSCCVHEISPVDIFADTKVGILEESQAGQCVKKRMVSKSFQDYPESFQVSCSAKSNALGCITQSLSQLESMSPQSSTCLSNTSSATQMSTPSNCTAVLQESPSYQSKLSKSNYTGPIPDTISRNEDLPKKIKVKMQTTYETGNGECPKDCGCNKCFTAEEIKKKAEVIKSISRRTYSGPIRRQIVRTKSGGKKTIMIVKKASLKSLQAKGLIQPLTTKYMVNHPHPLQSSKKNIAPCVSVSGDDHSSETLKTGSCMKSSTVQVQTNTDENCIRVSSTESRDEPHVSSHTSQTPKPQAPNQDSQAPVSVSWAPVNGSNALSFTFTVTLPTGASKPPDTSQDPMQIVKSLLKNGAQCTRNQPNLQDRDLLNPNQMTDSSSLKGGKESVSASAHSIISSQDPFQISTSAGSSKSVLPSPILNTHIPSKKINPNSDSCSFRTTNSTRSASTATLTHKQSNPHPFYTTIPNLPCESSSEKKKIHFNKSPEENNEGDRPYKTRPQNTDSVQWIALPSAPVHQLQSSLQGTLGQTHQAGFTRKCQMSNTTLHSSEQSSASLDHKGKRLRLPPSYRSPNRELKVRCAHLLNKHRRRYYLLLKKYKTLEKKFSAIKDVGTPQQVIRDARKYLSEDLTLFFESQMFLRNRSGPGNRFSRKFMKLMIDYYNRSAAGYKFLRTIFTVPSVATIHKWLSKPIEMMDEDTHGDSNEDSETGNEEISPPHMIKLENVCQDSNSVDDYDSEAEHNC